MTVASRSIVTGSTGSRPSARSSRSRARETALDGLAQTAPEALGQLQRRRRSRHVGDRAQFGSGPVGAQLLDVIQAIAADQPRFRQRHDELAARHAAAAPLDRQSAPLGCRLGIDQLDQPGAARELADAHQPGIRRQPLVVGAKTIRPGPLSPSTPVTPAVTSHHSSWQASATTTIPDQPDRKPRTQRGFLTQDPLTPPPASALTTSA
jgi:hypothetical protein